MNTERIKGTAAKKGCEKLAVDGNIGLDGRGREVAVGMGVLLLAVGGLPEGGLPEGGNTPEEGVGIEGYRRKGKG